MWSGKAQEKEGDDRAYPAAEPMSDNALKSDPITLFSLFSVLITISFGWSTLGYETTATPACDVPPVAAVALAVPLVAERYNG